MAFELDLTTTGVIVSCVAYVLFYTLFVIAQLWWGFALIATGFYFVPLLYAVQKRQAGMLSICVILHIIGTLSVVAWTIFFFVEIFANNKIVVDWLLVYTKNSDEGNQKDVARYGCIAMSANGLVVSLVLFATTVLCIMKIMNIRLDEATLATQRVETLAIDPDMEMDLEPLSEILDVPPIPRVNHAFSVGSIHYTDPYMRSGASERDSYRF